MRTFIFAVVVFMGGSASAQQAFDDCMLQNLKDVSGVDAVSAVTKACRSKSFALVYREFGEISFHKLQLEGWEIKGANLLTVINNPSSKTATFVMISASLRDKDGLCWRSKETRFKVIHRAGQKREYELPAPIGDVTKESLCVSAVARLARTGRVSDFLPVPATNMTAADYDLIEQAYSSKLGFKFEP